MIDKVRQHVTVQHEDRTLAAAEIQLGPDQESMRASLSVDAGQLPPGTRARLVDAVLDLPGVTPGTQLKATMPAGDGEMLDQVRRRCKNIEARTTGATMIVDATVEPTPR